MDLNFGPQVRRGPDLKISADCNDVFSHLGQPKPKLVFSEFRMLWHADTVVTKRRAEFTSAEGQIQGYSRCVRVIQSVG